ncbi:polysaccharide deacetylase family protein [Candidatus Saccharibacteria bacterium]|nr:polysaccharide deacetylase family protein [Candidatus Saccharibacteria bacterium]MBQ6313609.1 polysaccharide deacetylase family protein [Candidatus Saccharibacteria bacterium]
MNMRAKSSSNKPKESRSFFSRINLWFPWLKIVFAIFLISVIILDLLNFTISKTANLNDSFPTTPMSKHVKATERTLKGKKLVALTFDDGPSSNTTPQLLDILTKKNTVATFFVLGAMAKKQPEIIKRAKSEGHQIASHTMYHQNLTGISQEAAEADINESRSVFKSITGYSPTLTRPPYGIFNETIGRLSKTPLILWSVDPEDWKYRDIDMIVSIIMKQVHDGAIILMHDIYPTSVTTVPIIIDKLRDEGYEFVTISEMAENRGINLYPGGSYYKF